jgi:hypothetical protein
VIDCTVHEISDRDRRSDLPVGRIRLAEAPQFDLTWARIALFGVTTSACTAITWTLLRSGLPTSPGLPSGCVLIVAAALLGPLLIPMRGGLVATQTRAPIMSLAVVAVTASLVLALWLGRALLPVYALIALGGLRRASTLLRNCDDASFRWTFASAAVFSIYLFNTVLGLNYAGVYTPEQSLLGTLNHDTTFHAAIAFLIRNFGTPSIGVDGVLPLKYHFGSHFWFAALSAMTSADPTSVYGAAVPIVAAPLLVVAAPICGASIDGGRKSPGSYIIIGVGLIFLSDLIDQKSYYISESYTSALVVLLLALPILASLAQTGESSKSAALHFAIAIVLLPNLAILKVSVGVLWTAALVWLAIRRLGLSWRAAAASGTALLVLATTMSVASPGRSNFPGLNNDLIIPFYYFRYFPSLSSYSSLFLPTMLALSQVKRFGGYGLRATFVNRSDLMLEVTIIVTLLGLGPPLLGIPQDSSVYYFMNVSQWFAIGLLTARLQPAIIWRSINVLSPGLTFAVFAASVFLQLTVFSPGVYATMRNLLIAADDKAQEKLLAGRSPVAYFIDTLSREHVLWGSDFRGVLATSAGSEVIRAVRAAAPTPERDLAVFIPPDNLGYWTLHKTCNDKHNVQVSLTGQPSLLGGPPASLACPIDAHTVIYGTNFLARAITDSDLCSHARDRSIRRVLVLEESRITPRNRILDCTVRAGREGSGG